MKKEVIVMPKVEKDATIEELRSTLNVLTHAIQAGEKESLMKIHNLNKRIGDLEEKNTKLYKRFLALDRRQGITDADILTLNGSILTIGGKDASVFKQLPGSTTPQTTIADIFGKVTNEIIFTVEEPEGEPEPVLEITGIELHKGGKKCTVEF